MFNHNWQIDDDRGSSEVTWRSGSYVVTATQFEDGEWIIRYGTDGASATELYSRGVYTPEEADLEVQACMDDLTHGSLHLQMMV